MSPKFTDLDLDLPVATLLRTATADVHERVEHTQGAGWLVRAELEQAEYVRFLMMLWHIYDTLERAIERHASHPTLQPTYHPALLSRSLRLSVDISSLLRTSESSWQSHPVHTELMRAPPSAMKAYTTRIQDIAESSDPSPLLAHAYVRYLGDLSGGQTIRRRIAKAYNLEDGVGTSFYDFQPLGGTGTATMGDMKKIKEWYRDGMNTSVGDDHALKLIMLREAITAFELNEALFESLRGPPAVDAATEDITTSKVVYEAPESGSYSISSVVAVVAALSLAHFFLVVGGFTGEKGSAKLEALQRWLFAA